MEEGHTVFGIDNLFGGYQDTLSFLSKKGGEKFSSILANITDHEEIPFLSKELIEREIETIYHCAAIAPEGYSVFSPSIICNSVFMGSTVMGTVAIRSNVKRFINCSSMSRYGDQEGPFTENMQKKPVDPYALAKSSAEDMLTMLGDMHGMTVIHTAPHNVIGPRQRYTDPYRNVISIMANLMLQGRQPIIYGDGSQTRCFSSIQDDVLIYLKLLTHDVYNGEVFNIGPDDREISILELSKLIASILNFDLNPIFEKQRPHEVMHPICSSDKIRERFGFKPSMTLEDGIVSTVEYIKERGPAPFEYHVPLEINNKKNIPETWRKEKF
jgi:UDP-glucose 4-epimerase